ncbi:bile acid:sodium symporter family protein [Immundisolibacter sp.]|uniref:bile acid:sodium symporter family protein n=1 Tax=Immundisolibacter sp. TaxID=1934948 RepID=UPI00356252AB
MISQITTAMLILLMFGMGLGLTTLDFRRVAEVPKATLIGLCGQLLLLPALGFALCLALNLSRDLAMGVMLLTLCPGGVLSNLFTLLGRGDVALSVTMTTISSMVTVFTLPIVLNISLLAFSDSSVQFRLPVLQTALQILVVTIIPVSLGMVVLHRAPFFAQRASRWVRTSCTIFLPLVIGGILFKNGGEWLSNFAKAGALAVTLNLLAIVLGYALGKLSRLDARQVRTLSIEVGAQNAMLGVTIALSPFLLNSPQIAIVPSIYAVTMVIMLWAYVTLTNRSQDNRLVEASAPVK